MACGIFPDQGSNPCTLHWQADAQSLDHQGSPHILFIHIYLLLTFCSICFFYLLFVHIYISINVYVCVCVYTIFMNRCLYVGSLPLNNIHFLRIKCSFMKPALHLLLSNILHSYNTFNQLSIFQFCRLLHNVIFFFSVLEREDPIQEHLLHLVVISLVSFNLEQFHRLALFFMILTPWEI